MDIQTEEHKARFHDHRECQEHQSKRTVKLLSSKCAQPLLSVLSSTSEEIHNRDPTTSIVFPWTSERSVFTDQHVFFFLLELRIVRRGRGTFSTVLTPSRGATSAQITTSMTTESRKIEGAAREGQERKNSPSPSTFPAMDLQLRSKLRRLQNLSFAINQAFYHSTWTIA